ncbi:MAG: ribose 5-phosphate isomerase B, partial [Planctomycetales bacterium]|nr:ribose 5-phosphate isomerase B [Planctomycetales bacterium]
AIASDHHGVSLKAQLVGMLKGMGYDVSDEGPASADAVDYPDFAARVSRKVADGQVDSGVLICGSGIGMAIAANRFPGVRAAVCYDAELAELSRRHNNANVVCLSGDRVSADANAEIVRLWLATDFDGGRHARRVDKLEQFPGNQAESC